MRLYFVQCSDDNCMSSAAAAAADYDDESNGE